MIGEQDFWRAVAAALRGKGGGMSQSEGEYQESQAEPTWTESDASVHAEIARLRAALASQIDIISGLGASVLERDAEIARLQAQLDKAEAVVRAAPNVALHGGIYIQETLSQSQLKVLYEAILAAFRERA